MTKMILRLERLPSPGADDAAPEPPARHVVDLGDRGRAPSASTPLAHWSAAVAAAHDPCIVLDPQGQILSLSATAAELLGCSEGGVIGRRLLDVMHVVDFDTGALGPDYAARIAPLAVLHAGSGLMRSLLRVRAPDGDRVTVDASSAPIHDARGATVGSLTFLAAVRG